MSKKELLIREIDEIPESFLDEVMDFVQFLKAKNEEGCSRYYHCKRIISKERLAQAGGR